MPLRLDEALPHPLTASILMLLFVEQRNLDSGHRLCHLTSFLLFYFICSTADDELFTKNSTFSNYILVSITCIYRSTIHRGGAEFAGPEKVDQKRSDWKLQDLGNDGANIRAGKCKTWNMMDPGLPGTS